VIRYVYLSRGGWLIRSFQGFIDRLRPVVAREDRRDVTDAYMEVHRSFSYLCLLIATDDGSERSKIAIAEAVASHRETVSRLRLVFGGAGGSIAAEILRSYVDATYFTNLERDAVRIPAGAFSESRYQSFEQSSQSVQGEP